jgi:transcriptional regulator with XRE-family HTH domain
MIKNERQYRISKSQLDRFVERISEIGTSENAFAEIHRAAHQSEIDILSLQISEYEALVRGDISVFSVSSLDDLPSSLIKARIARGKTQKELAAILGLKEQQVQRWEADNYEAASLATLKSVATALNVGVASDLIVMKSASDMPRLFHRLAACGFDKAMLARILPTNSYTAIISGLGSGEAIWNALVELSSVFGISIRRLLDADSPLPFVFGSRVRYKLRTNADSEKVDAFTVYAHYVAALACKACEHVPMIAIPQEWSSFRNAILADFGKISLQSVLDYTWNCGIIVIPICYSGAFHGAVWKIGGRHVIVVKQTTSQTARWLFDLLHEIGHVVNNHVSETSAVIEIEPIGQKESDTDDDETVANEWAEDVLFNGDSDRIEKAVVKAASGNVRMMKAAIEKVADTFEMDVGILANHMAWRLADQQINWWGAAENLQKGLIAPDEIVRKGLLTHVNLAVLNEFDRDMFIRAIEKQ